MNRVLRFWGEMCYVLLHVLFNAIRGVFKRIYSGYIFKSLAKVGSYTLIEPYVSVIVGGKYISIGYNTYICKRATITAWKYSDNTPKLSIGNHVYIGDGVHITASNTIEIGDNVQFGKHVTITDNSHGTLKSVDELNLHPSKRETTSKGPVIIEDCVWLGDKVTVCPNVHIGKGAVVGANSVVTKDIPSYSIVAGVPAKILRQLKN